MKKSTNKASATKNNIEYGIRIPCDPSSAQIHPVGDLNRADQVFREALFTADTKAWMKLAAVLKSAQEDPEINCNPQALEFLQAMRAMSGRAWGHWDLNKVLAPMVEAITTGNARTARQKRTDGSTGLVKARALALYDASKWTSTASAAKAIYADLRAYVDTVKGAKYPSQERFAKTLGDWLTERKNNTANS